MKEFMKIVLGTVVGLFLTFMIISILSILSLAGMMINEGMSSPIKDNSILKINLSGTMQERAESNPLAMIMGEEAEGIALDNALTALDKAAKNEKVKGVYIEAGILGSSPAMAQELRQAIVKFKKSGKWVIAYGDRYSKMSYYIASAADEVLLNPSGSVDFSGMASTLMFFKETLAKLGVKMQVFKVGTYKSAVEPYICTEMSDANREQISSYLGDVWSQVLKDVSKSRKRSEAELNSLADTLTVIAKAETSVEGGLVDRLCYIDEVKETLRKKMGLDDDDDDELIFTTIDDMAKSESLDEKVDDQVAVYYAYGEIVDIAAQGGFSQEHQIVGSKMVNDLQQLRKDDDIKAVVIRVNSPGGSAYASEQIWREIMLLKKEKPVVVSMGGLAASGGYYISCPADKIYAENTTLTGSIGIFGMIPDASELITDKLGVRFDGVKTNKMSDLGANLGRPFNEAESAMLQSMVEDGYDLFTRRVAEGRGIPQDSVKVIGEGRVWTGRQGLKVGLVDKIGNLEDAISSASKLAKLKEYRAVPYPQDDENPFTAMFNKSKSGYLDSQIRETLGEYYSGYSIYKNLRNMNPIQARMPFDVVIK